MLLNYTVGLFLFLRTFHNVCGTGCISLHSQLYSFSVYSSPSWVCVHTWVEMCVLQYVYGGQKQHLGINSLVSFWSRVSLDSAALNTPVFTSLFLNVLLRLQMHASYYIKWVLQVLDKNQILGVHYKHLDLLNHPSALMDRRLSHEWPHQDQLSIRRQSTLHRMVI